ncbi:phage gp29-like protein [Varunaivibrio sulfuroxidans]|uniref:Phage gp29-like protein n=1 Tax=Varunaivibrio sulfuroxidans TaxID=1773489 RepID=A0A4R3JBU7_9PROT|nr:DUF935 domain-containing protein [Varunaivibrio sulfuroxidans]TCS62576.1 phage gp29-like protein [Varunaivibrio sulfuroxidans]
MLTDQWGRPMKKSDLARELSAPTLKGVRGLQGGHPAQGLTPGRLAAILREAETGDATRYLEMAEEIEEKDLHYLGVLGTRKRQVAQLELTVIPGGDTQDDLDNADLIRGWLDREELEDELFDILDSVGKGYSVAEIMWDTSGGQWTPTRLIWRDPRWFRFDPMDGVTLRLIGAGGALEPLAAYKFIRHRTKAKSGLPIRGGLARAAAWGYLFKNFDVRDWVIFAERFGHPLRVGRYGAHATKEEKEVLLSAVANIASDAACIIPQGMELEFIEAKITGNVDMFEKFADWIDRQISKAVLGQTLTTEVKGGSLAAARVHGGVKDDIERADAKELSATLNRDLVRPMIDLNKGPQKRYPKIRIGRADETDLAQMTDSLAKLVPVGLKVSAKQVRDKLGLSAPDGADDVLTAPAAAPPSAAPPGPSVSARARAVAVGETAGDVHIAPAAPAAPDAIETFIAELAAGDDWAAAIDDITGPLIDRVENAKSYDDLIATLARALDGMDAGALAEKLARATFQARLAGGEAADLKAKNGGN